MRSYPHTRNFLTTLLIICFSIYSGSPLAGSFQPNFPRSARAEVEKPSVKIYVVHLLLTSIFDDNNDTTSTEKDDPSDDDLYLVKKKKIAYSAKKLLPVFSPTAVATVLPDVCKITTVLHARPAFFLPKPAAVQYLIVPHHSGNAPPSA